MKKMKSPLATALQLAYDRAITARESVEYRLASIPRQEVLVQRWLSATGDFAAEEFPGKDVQSYPVQTRISSETSKLERYKSELFDRAIKYEESLNSLEKILKKIDSNKKYASLPEIKATLKSYPLQLRHNPWPAEWPEEIKNRLHDRQRSQEFTLTRCTNLPSPQAPTPTPFNIWVAGHQIELFARYKEGIPFFEAQLQEFNEHRTSSRWPAILEAICCGISWPQLDWYLDETNEPWLPTEFVSEMFGLRGTLVRRNELADLMNRVSQGAAHWYLTQHPGRGYLHKEDVDFDLIEELMSINLIQWGPDMPPSELLRSIPFPEVKFLFAYADIVPPRGYDAAIAKYDLLLNAYGKDELMSEITNQVDATHIIEVLEPEGWDREDRLGPRARANILVSSLIYLHEGHSGPLRILNWNK